MKHKIEILITIISLDWVSVRWLVPLDRVAGGVYRALKETLEDIRGVESVQVRRYSAEVEVAAHVATPKEVAEAIVQALSDEASEFQYALRFSVMEPEIKIDNAGR